MSRLETGDTVASDPRSVKQAAYERFRTALFSRRLRPGQIVSQRELVAMLGLSIGTLRELLPRLHHEGLIIVMPQRGIQITQIDLPMIRQAFQFRLALEREAVLDAVRRMDDRVLAEQETRHHAIVDAVRDNPSDDVFAQAQAIDDGFHELLVNATQNDILIQAHTVNSIRIRLIKLDCISLSQKVFPSAFVDHLAVIAAIRARDACKAVDAIELHIMNARERALNL